VRTPPIAALLASALAASGCGTTYTPRPGPRVSMVIDGGTPAYTRDGRTYPAGFLGGGLVDAVAGVPAAEEHARTFRDRNVGGFAASLAGLGLVLGGTLQTLHDARDHDPPALGLGLVAAGLAAELVGLALVASAQPHQLDAINVYNDAVEARPAPAPGGVPAGYPWVAPKPAPAAPVAPPAPSAPSGAPAPPP
jgi:hypothetical protein